MLHEKANDSNMKVIFLLMITAQKMYENAMENEIDFSKIKKKIIHKKL